MKKCKRKIGKLDNSMSILPITTIGTIAGRSFHQDATIREETSEEIRKYF